MLAVETQSSGSSRARRRPLPTQTEDAALVAALVRDDPKAWRTFNERYSALLLRCITRVTSRFRSMVTPDDVREIYATLCLQLLANDKAKLRSYEPERGSRLGSWLGLLATHAAYDFLRSRRREPRPEHTCEPESLTSTSPNPFDECELRERARIVAEMVGEFTERDQLFITLYFGEGVEPEEIAARMGISVKTVYSKKHKIQSRLESLLERRKIAA